MAKLKLKHILKYQQGGNIVTTFSPEPRNFISPIQGINPSVLQYDVRSAPIDMSQLTQVMQFNSNLRFQKEKNEKDLSLEREKLQFQKDKLNSEMEAEWYKQIAAEFKTAKAVNKEVTGSTIDDLDRMESSPFYLNKDSNYKSLLEQEQMALQKLITGKPFDTRNLMERQNIEKRIQGIASKLPMFSQLRADDRIHTKLLDIYTDDKSDIKLHNPSFLDYNERRLNHIQTGSDTYKLGEGFKAMYSLKGEQANYAKILEKSTTSYEKDFTRVENGILVSDKKVIVPSPEVAAKNATESVLNSPGTFYFMDEIVMGGSLFPLEPEKQKKALEEHFLSKVKEIQASAAAMNNTQGSEFKGQLPKEAGDKTVTINYNTPGKSQKNPNDVLNSFGLDAKQKAVVGQALIKAKAKGIDTNDPFYVAKVADEVLKNYDPTTGTGPGLSDESLGKIKAEGEAAISKEIRSKLNSNPIIKNMSEEDKRLAATFLANPAFQDAFYTNVFYPKDVLPLFNKVKTGQISVHESLKGLNDNQLKYIIHHQGPTHGLYYLKNGKVSPNSGNPESQTELNRSLPKLVGSESEDFIKALKERGLEGDYDSVYAGNVESSAIGAYGVLFQTHKQAIIDFMNGNSDLITRNVDLNVSDADLESAGGSVYELIGTTKVFDSSVLDNNPILKVEKDEGGREWLVAPKENENAQRALVQLGLLDKNTVGWPDFGKDVNVDEVGEAKVQGLTVVQTNKAIKIAIKGTPKVKPPKAEGESKSTSDKSSTSDGPKQPGIFNKLKDKDSRDSLINVAKNK